MSAVGDIVSGLTYNVAKDAELEIKPAGTEQWVVHNIYCEDVCWVYWNTASHKFVIAIIATGGSVLTGMFFHVNATQWITVMNKHASDAKGIGYDGVISRL